MSSQLPSSQPPLGFIHLILLSQKDPLYLEVPTTIVTTLCLRPRKYLQYLGWCVLGVIGTLQDGQGNEIALDGELVDQGVYRYIVPSPNVLACAIDLEVIKQRSQISSEITGTPEDFRTRLLERDGRCVWTGLTRPIVMDIIPYRRGNEACSYYSDSGMRTKSSILLQWLQLIIENRPHNENLSSLPINDIQNGFCATATLHNNFFEPRKVVILKTPNPILQTTDVPARYQRKRISTSVSYPCRSRYTLQWIVTPDDPIDLDLIRDQFPTNNDATFMNQQLPKPSEFLLHYNYGAAAVKHWGKNTSVLTNRPNIPRPSVPTPAKIGSPKAPHNRSTVINKREGATSEGQRASGSKRRKTSEQAAGDLEVQDKWDEDDVMLYIWGNSKVALERHAQKKEEHTAYLEAWRATATGNPDMV